MYERMLDKSVTPDFDDMIRYAGECGKLWSEFNARICKICPVQTTIRFPYGNKYGWSVRYGTEGKTNKHICDAFAEKNAFTVHFRIGDKEIGKVFHTLSDYSKNIWNNKYPCGDGGWLSYRVLAVDHLDDLIKILESKITGK